MTKLIPSLSFSFSFPGLWSTSTFKHQEIVWYWVQMIGIAFSTCRSHDPWECTCWNEFRHVYIKTNLIYFKDSLIYFTKLSHRVADEMPNVYKLSEWIHMCILRVLFLEIWGEGQGYREMSGDLPYLWGYMYTCTVCSLRIAWIRAQKGRIYYYQGQAEGLRLVIMSNKL